MSTLYNQREVWYLDVTIHSKRIRRSLHTKHKSTATKLAKQVENEIIKNVLTGNRPVSAPNLSLKALIREFLASNHGWRESTYSIYEQKLAYYPLLKTTDKTFTTN